MLNQNERDAVVERIMLDALETAREGVLGARLVESTADCMRLCNTVTNEDIVYALKRIDSAIHTALLSLPERIEYK